jgi:hypothetical protein
MACAHLGWAIKESGVGFALPFACNAAREGGLQGFCQNSMKAGKHQR